MPLVGAVATMIQEYIRCPFPVRESKVAARRHGENGVHEMPQLVPVAAEH
jgi:hypothetical protein